MKLKFDPLSEQVCCWLAVAQFQNSAFLQVVKIQLNLFQDYAYFMVTMNLVSAFCLMVLVPILS